MPSLSVRNLEVTFVDRTLFRGVSFDVEARDKMGFIGANGVGKTTLFRVLSGELSPTSGTVAFEKTRAWDIWNNIPAKIPRSVFLTSSCRCSVT